MASNNISENGQLQAKENHEVLTHYFDLESTISTITALTQRNPASISTAQVMKELQAMQQAANGICTYFGSRIPTKHFNELRPEGSTTACRVLTIPELLEIILENSAIEEIMTMCQVSKELLAIIKGSPKLQIKLGFGAADKSKFQEHQFTTSFASPTLGELTHPGFHVEVNPPSLSNFMGKDRHIDVQAEFRSVETTNSLPQVGTAWRHMFICQPPVNYIQGTTMCTMHGSTGRTMAARSESGLKVGDLRDAAAILLRGHYPCYSCSPMVSSYDLLMNGLGMRGTTEPAKLYASFKTPAYYSIYGMES